MPKPLTIQHVLDSKFTYLDLVGYFRPDWGEDQRDFYLWNFTCHPFDLETTIEQLNMAFLRTEYLFSLLNPEE